MLIRLIPPSPHPTVLYGLTFPSILPLHDISPPVAWTSQLQILTSILQLEPPSSIHMLDRAVGLVARVDQVSMNVPRKEVLVKFVDGRVTTVPMNSDCVRMLLGVVLDVKGCSESESQRNSMDGSACATSTASTIDDTSPGGSPTKSSKTGKHKRQRSLLFSLISSLVPKSLSSPLPFSSRPPPAPLPPLPVSRVTSPPASPRKASFPSELSDPELLRRRARATLVDVWRRHVVSALSPQHLPAAGYAEWTLVAMASEVRAEMESFGSARPGGSRHRRARSECRNALDLGDPSDDCEFEYWRPHTPSPTLNMEETDRIVYPRREQDEWGIRFVHPESDEAHMFAVEYNGDNDCLLGGHFMVGDNHDDSHQLTFELSSDTAGRSLGFDGRYPGDFSLGYDDSDDTRVLAHSAFDVSRCPLIPSDVDDDEESYDTQTSLQTPEDEDDIPLARSIQALSRHASSSRSSLVSRIGSSRPRSRTDQFSRPPSVDHSLHSPTPSTCPYSIAHDFDCRGLHIDDFMVSHLDYMERISAALEVVRCRAREEGWKLVRATQIGAKNGWMDAESESALEIKAKRRAWSSGIRVSHPYPVPRSSPRVWDGKFTSLRLPMRPPGLNSPTEHLKSRGPIVPAGLCLGIPVRSSPLATYVWGADDEPNTIPGICGILKSPHAMETIEGKKSSRVSFADNVTKLFPVCEDENEALFGSIPDDAINFPQTVPLSVSAGESDCHLMEGFMENEDDPFCCSSRPRMRTTSMYMNSASPTMPSTPLLPMFRPSTPPPSYQVAVGGDISSALKDNEGRLDASALLLQPLSSLSLSSSSGSSSEPPLVSKPSLLPRPRSVSLPTPKSDSSTHKTRRTSFNLNGEHFEDLSRAYASPPPEGPLVVSAVPAPQVDYPRYAHVHSPMPTSKKRRGVILGKTKQEVVFEQAGSEFTVGIEVALGRAEEGRVVW